MSSDRGTTLTEVLVVMAISAVVVPSLYLAVVSGFRQERTQESAHVLESKVGDVADRLAEDIRETWPSDKRQGDAQNELSLEYFDEKGSLMRIFWYSDGDSLVRLVMMGESGRTVSKVEMLEQLKVERVFRYWTAKGSEITEGRGIASCAVRVTVSLRSVRDGGDADTSLDVAHRLRNPEAEPC